MSQHMLLTISDPAKTAEMEALLDTHFGSALFRRAGSAAWIIKTGELTTKDASARLFGADISAVTMTHVIVRFDSYWGFNDRDLWEWLSAQP